MAHLSNSPDPNIQAVKDYGPLLKMQQQAANLRAELGMASGVSEWPMSNPFRLSVQIPAQGTGDAARKVRVSTPGNPYFKPARPFANNNKPGPEDDKDPFTPLGKPGGSQPLPRGRSLRSSSRGTGSLHKRASDATVSSSNTLGPGGLDAGIGSPTRSQQQQRDCSPTSSVTSRRSLSSPTKSVGSCLGATSHSGGPHGRAGSLVKASLAMQEANAVLTARVHALELELDHVQAAEHELRADLEARQSSYMRREDALQAQINKLQEELAVARGERMNGQDGNKFGKASNTIQELHGQVVQEIEALLSKQEVAIKHEEHTQTRRLKAKLAQVEAELGAEKGANGRTHADWMERTAALRQELDTMQDIATKLDAMYKLSEEECGRLRAQFKCQEDDRELLVRQVVFLKKENKRLAVELAAMAAEANAAAQQRDDALVAATASVTEQGILQGAPMGATLQDAVQVKVQRYEDVIHSLQKLCEAERKRTRHARAAHTAELAARTELQGVLRQLLDDVRQRQAAASAGINTTTRESGPGEARASLSGAATPRMTGDPGAAGVGGARLGWGGGSRPASASLRSGPGRPLSAYRISHASGSSWSTRPVSAVSTCTHSSPPGLPLPGGNRRPASAAMASDSRHSTLAGGSSTATAGGVSRVSGGGSARPPDAVPLGPEERAALLAELQRQEGLLLALMDRAFPTAAAQPLLPGDTPTLDRLAGMREARDAAVVAAGHALATVQASSAAAKQAGGGLPLCSPHAGAAGAKEVLAKEVVGRPWVFSVDTMMAEFLSTPAAP